MTTNLTHLLAMGGYGTYVWTAYGITLIVFGINIMLSLQERKATQRIIHQFFKQTDHES